MNEILNVYKPVGLTPLQLIEELRLIKPELKTVKIGFAGRLDPLAHGVMLLTIGEANKNRQQFLSLNKVYQFSVLFGVETDSYDYLGFLKSLEVSKIPDNLEDKILQFLESHTGTLTLPYPPFSSKTIKGVQLYKLAKAGKIKDADLPLRKVEIFKFNFLSTETVPAEKIKKEIIKNLRKIKGHFRQQKTIKKWKEFFALNPNRDFTLAHFEIDCSSGTYVRTLAHKMGQEFKCGAIAYEIYRTVVGEFKVDDSLKLTQ